MNVFGFTKWFTAMSVALLSACTGIADGIYDEPPAEELGREGQITVNATSWTDWHYIDLKTDSVSAPVPIPMTLTGESDGKNGQYLYWFDVFGEGVSKNEFRSFTPCDPQPEPAEWSIAVHRNNVRTNGGAVFETSYTRINQLPESSEAFADMPFTEDVWTENEVWDSQTQMLQSLVPSQGIKVNRVLSSWLTMRIPPMPPQFVHNNHVFILRLNDGTYAALQLEDYLSPTGTKCYLTINYKYPY